VRRVAPSPLEHGRLPRRLDHDFLWRDPTADQGFPETGDGADGDHIPPARARVTGEGDAGGHRFLGRVAVGPYHAAEDDRAEHRVVVQSQAAPVGDGAGSPQGGVASPDGLQDGLRPYPAEAAAVDASEGSLGAVLCRGAGAHRQRGFR